VLAAILPAARVHAFSNPETYDELSELGGGGGRWFTGSPADGFGCDVCHQGGAGVELSVTGLPLDAVVPGMAYEVTLSWPSQLDDLALIAEFTDEQRKSVGALALPRVDAYTPPELCAPDEGGSPATGVYGAQDGRMLVGVVDCGAHISRFQWTAPALIAGPIWFNAGFVASNGDATPEGDGVTLARRALLTTTASATRMVATNGCNIASLGTPKSGLLASLLFGMSVIARWWRRS
jgi:hypothetical protein